MMKGLLLLSVLSVYIYASGANVTRHQTGKQESEELAQAKDLSNSAVKLYNAEKYKDALNPAKQALEIRERTLPADDKRVIASVGNLAAIHLALKNYKEAEGFYKRLLAADEKRFGSETLQVAKTLDVLAWLHYARGNRSQAEAEYKRVLAIREKIAGTDSPEVAPTLFRLAEIYQSHGELEKAVPLYQRLIKFDDDAVLETNITVKDARYSFACLLRKMNKPDEADAVERRNSSAYESEGEKAAAERAADQGARLNGKALRLPRPAYPAEARAARVSGLVVVRVTISEEGKVVRACAVKGNPMLLQTAERAAYAAEFAPTMLLGKPVKVTGVITYVFSHLRGVLF
jgi:TonB family protein